MFQRGTPPTDLLKILTLGESDWDVIIVGDGSGSRWGYPGGWGAIIFDKRTGLRKTLYGALSDTTINICELSPYLYAMQWYIRGPGQDLQKELRKQNNGFLREIQVHIVTDCEIIADQGNRTKAREANAALWAGFDHFARLSYKLRFHHFRRDLFAANRACDALSKEMRHLITSIERKMEVASIPDAYDDQLGRPESDDAVTS